MKQLTLDPQSRVRLLQKRLILLKRRNHWEIIFDHLTSTPAEDRIGDLMEATQQLNELYPQIAALDRELGIRSRSRRTRTQIVKRSIVIAGRKTNISLEDAFWRSFSDVADQRRVTLSQLAAEIRAIRTTGSLSSAIRLFVLGLYRDRLSQLQK